MLLRGLLNFKTSGGNRIYQYLSAITGNLGIISSEMHYGWPSPSLPILRAGNHTFIVTSDEESWLAVMPLIGAILGATITGVIIDILGRKKMIVFSAFPFFTAWLMIGFARSSILVFVARFLAGLADGLSFVAVPMYLGEMAEPQIRGLLGSICPVSVVLGILLINIIGCFLDISTTAYISSAVPVILLLTFSWMPESPYFLLMRGRQEDARKSLQKFRGLADVEEELSRLSKAVEEQSTNTGRFKDLFTVQSNRKAVFIILGLRTVQQCSGTMPIVFYCKTIFEQAGDFIPPSVATIIFFTIQLILSAVSSFIVDISGRRPLILLSVAGIAIALFIKATYLYLKNCTEVDTSSFNFVPLAAMIFFIIMFSCGSQTIPLILIGEVFPTNVKAFALCLADIYFGIIATLVSKYFHFTYEAFGMHVPFYTFGVCCVLGWIFIYNYVPETKGKTLEDIQLYLKGEKEK